ncbi:hypothetical protein CYLTODRAFT_411482 [Cylindrobasidium torrendii FP15055 ss-10]|uniref:Uncharacterized protein n=1 Tax=Cylindrobasidium torrendii FP15055 ss-10 TaxID=1314674 RepID=A0A0D7B9X0_9AGAR|nr:hypothetical protein CYLTODRAFT_411482 [Cylindrobasidium torrendii FP15055 ss-10]
MDILIHKFIIGSTTPLLVPSKENLIRLSNPFVTKERGKDDSGCLRLRVARRRAERRPKSRIAPSRRTHHAYVFIGSVRAEDWYSSPKGHHLLTSYSKSYIVPSARSKAYVVYLEEPGNVVSMYMSEGSVLPAPAGGRSKFLREVQGNLTPGRP